MVFPRELVEELKSFLTPTTKMFEHKRDTFGLATPGWLVFRVFCLFLPSLFLIFPCAGCKSINPTGSFHIINAPRVSQRNVKIQGLSCFDVQDGDIRTIISVGMMSWLYLIWNVKITSNILSMHLLYNYGTPYLQDNRWYPFMILIQLFSTSHIHYKIGEW